MACWNSHEMRSGEVGEGTKKELGGRRNHDVPPQTRLCAHCRAIQVRRDHPWGDNVWNRMTDAVPAPATLHLPACRTAQIVQNELSQLLFDHLTKGLISELTCRPPPVLHSANRVRHCCSCWNWAETWGFGALAVLLTHLQKAHTSKTSSARPDVFSRVRQIRRVPLSRRYRPPPTPLPKESSVLKEKEREREGSGPSLDSPRLSQSTIVPITTLSVQIWHHRRFVLSKYLQA